MTGSGVFRKARGLQTILETATQAFGLPLLRRAGNAKRSGPEKNGDDRPSRADLKGRAGRGVEYGSGLQALQFKEGF